MKKTKTSLKWKVSTRKVSKGRRKMSEMEKDPTMNGLNKIDISKEDDSGRLEIRAEKGNTGRLEIYFRHPVLADVISSMALGNYPKEEYAKEYAPILMDFPNPKAVGRVVTRPAIVQATKQLEAATDFDFTKPPRAILLCNPDALRQGYSLFVDLKSPVAPETLRKWGKLLMDGSNDIIAASRPYKMTWVATEEEMAKV